MSTVSPAPAPQHRRTRRRIRRFGWIPDLPDRRDHLFTLPPPAVALPSTVDLSSSCPGIYDQGNLGSCTAHAIAGAIEFDQMRQKLEDVFVPSRLFIYYNERVIEGTVDEDSGAMLRDGIKSVNTYGAPHERLWPYDVVKFRTRPPKASFTDGERHRTVSYQRVLRSLGQMRGCLAAGLPFVFGFTVYESFESDTVARTGVVPLPHPDETVLGGHAVLAVGYDDKTSRFLVRNSWGVAWGTRGYFTLPYDYLLDPDLSDDFWTIKIVE
jgi:C1A family cysteine protease